MLLSYRSCCPHVVEVAPIPGTNMLPCIIPAYVFVGDLSKMTSFLLLQMDQHNAEVPTKICFLYLSPEVRNQVVNMSVTLLGPFIPNTKKTARQRNLA
jgi:hypothetical protein